MSDWKQLRALFPALADQVWVNAAASSPLPRPVFEEGVRFLESVHLRGDRDLTSWLEGVQRTRELVASLLGGAPGDVAFTSGTSHSMNVIAQLLHGLGRREVVTFADEFPAGPLPFLHAGFSPRFLRPRGGVYPPEEIADALRPGGVLLASHVQFGSGHAFDPAALARLCRERDCLFVLNVTQSLGARPLDGAELADCVAATGHKWACAGFGAGMLRIRPELVREGRLPFAGWLSMRNPDRMENDVLDPRPDASAAEVGTMPFDTVLRLGVALELLQSYGFDAIHGRIVELTTSLREGLRRLGLSPSTPDDPRVRSGITSFAHPDADRLAEGLAAKRIFTSVRRGSLRISLHAYNDESDVERTLEALGELLQPVK